VRRDGGIDLVNLMMVFSLWGSDRRQRRTRRGRSGQRHKAGVLASMKDSKRRAREMSVYLRRKLEKKRLQRRRLTTAAGSTRSERTLQRHYWARRMDSFLQEFGNTMCGVSYGAKRGRKGSVDGFITSTRTWQGCREGR
jgi:hypothetical protein